MPHATTGGCLRFKASILLLSSSSDGIGLAVLFARTVPAGGALVSGDVLALELVDELELDIAPWPCAAFAAGLVVLVAVLGLGADLCRALRVAAGGGLCSAAGLCCTLRSFSDVGLFSAAGLCRALRSDTGVGPTGALAPYLGLLADVSCLLSW